MSAELAPLRRTQPALVAAGAARRAAVYGLLIFGGLLYAAPFLWMVSTSLKEPGAAVAFPPTWLPDPVEWRNYLRAWTVLPFGDFTRNSVIYAGVGLVGQLLSCSLAAFGFARIVFKGREFWFAVLLATMMLPNQVTLIPQFILFKNLGWLDTLLPLIVPTFFGHAFYIFLLRQFFLTLPTELDDAARIDGAHLFDVYRRIILPLAKPALATVAIFSFVNHWNDFFGPLIYLTTPEKMTIAVGLQLFRGQWGTDFSLLMAASTAALMPILILFFVAQKTFVQGIALTGMKG
ncbi:MAG TPA: carbohydrate ABC transporter permease [Chloroflexota bacterium]|jgi:ABC-type glycerol-3-phosphate transport system permease component